MPVRVAGHTEPEASGQVPVSGEAAVARGAVRQCRPAISRPVLQGLPGHAEWRRIPGLRVRPQRNSRYHLVIASEAELCPVITSAVRVSRCWRTVICRHATNSYPSDHACQGISTAAGNRDRDGKPGGHSCPSRPDRGRAPQPWRGKSDGDRTRRRGTGRTLREPRPGYRPAVAWRARRRLSVIARGRRGRPGCLHPAARRCCPAADRRAAGHPRALAAPPPAQVTSTSTPRSPCGGAGRP